MFQKTMKPLLRTITLFLVLLICTPMASCGIHTSTAEPTPTIYTGPDYIVDDDIGVYIGDLENLGGFNNENYVPDKATAILLAEIYLQCLISESEYKNHIPLNASYDSAQNVWLIYGKEKDNSELLSIRKKDGLTKLTVEKTEAADLVPDADTAYRIMSVYLSNLFTGWPDQKPYHIGYNTAMDLWHIQGTVFRSEYAGQLGTTGGQIDFNISKESGKILLVALSAD